jgi:hypothetical protein
MKRYAVVFEKTPNNWAAWLRDHGQYPGRHAPLIAEAIEFHIEGMRLHGETVPEPTAIAESIAVQAA